MDYGDALQAIQSWPLQEQLDFAFEVWDNIVDGGLRPEPNAELKAELDRRLAAHEADPSRVLTWEQVLTHLRRSR